MEMENQHIMSYCHKSCYYNDHTGILALCIMHTYTEHAFYLEATGVQTSEREGHGCRTARVNVLM